MKAKLFAALSIGTMTKRLWKSFKYCFTSSFSRIDRVTCGLNLLVRVTTFMLTVFITVSLHGLNSDVFNLFLSHNFSIQTSRAVVISFMQF